MPPTPDNLEGNDTMAPPPAADQSMQPTGENVICVPVDALSLPDEGDKMTPPAEGDKVQASIEGEIVSVNGAKAYVKLSAVNGQEVKDEAQPDDASEEAALQGQAAAMPPLQ